MTDRDDELRPVSKRQPCAICGKPDWCRRSASGGHECHRESAERVGEFAKVATTNGGFSVYRAAGDEPRARKARKIAQPNSTTAKHKPHVFPGIDDVRRMHERDGDVTVADYHTASGKIAMHVVRVDKRDGSKDFRPYYPEGRGLVCGDPPGLLPLYGLADLLAAPSEAVFILEGEKAATLARAIGLLATTSAHGGSSAQLTDWTPLKGRKAVILPDADRKGMEYARTVAAILLDQDEGADVRIVELPGLPPAGDIVEYCSALGDGADAAGLIVELAAKTRPFGTGPTPIVRCFDDIEEDTVSWLWPGRFAQGKLGLLVGDPGLGKSFITVAMAAAVSRGAPWPDAPGVPQEPGDVLFLAAEDDPGDTTKPRLRNAGADMRRVFILDAVDRANDGKPECVALSTDVGAIEKALTQLPNPRLIVVDPLSSYMGCGTDTHRDADVRRILMPFADMARRTGIAIVGIMHLRKAATTNAVHRGNGSISFVAASRTAWALVRDKEDPARSLLLQIKNNLARDPGGLSLHIAPPGVVMWGSEPVTISADEAMAENRPGPKPEKTRAVADKLFDLLASGAMPSAEVDAWAKAEGIAISTLKRAKKMAGVQARREGMPPHGTWTCYLPSSACERES